MDGYKTNYMQDELALDKLIGNYGLTLKDMYDIVNLRAYERRQHYAIRHQMPNEAYL